MANTRISIKPTLDQLKSRLRRANEKLSNMSGANAKAAVLLDQWTQRNFQTEGSNVGKWDKLKAGGRWIKGKGLDTTAKILQDKGRLKSSFLPFSTKRNAGIGSDLPYSEDHEKGLGALPIRRMLPDSKKDPKLMGKIKKVFVGHVKGSFENV